MLSNSFSLSAYPHYSGLPEQNMLYRIKRYLKKIAGLQEAVPSKLSPKEGELISRIRSERLTYLSDRKLTSLVNTCRAIEESNLSGIFLESGCALGGSAILIASLKSSERPLFIYDVFGMIPSPTQDDTQDTHDRYQTIVEGKSEGIGGDKYYGYEENLYEIVQSNLKSFGINCEQQSVLLIKGLVKDTMKLDQPIAFAHIDVDWYEPVMTCLKCVFPNLVVGGSIILDDYHDWGGCRKATDEYLCGVTGQFVLDDSADSMKITKINSY
jgi:asparagine synthase (glutamine-hydrolysing)